MPNKANFNRTVMMRELLLELRGSMVGVNLINRNYQGEVDRLGETVEILSPSEVTIQSYSTDTDLTIQELSGTKQSFEIDQALAFSFYAHSGVERIADYIQAFTEDGVYRLAEGLDEDIMSKYADADHTVEFDPASDDFLAAVREARRKMSVAKVPEQGRWLVISPYEVEMIEDHLTNRETAGGDAVIRTGYAGQLYGFDVYSSHTAVEAAGVRHLMAGTRAAITLAEGISELEILRAEKRFADIVRGLVVWGSHVLRPEALVDFQVALPE